MKSGYGVKGFLLNYKNLLLRENIISRITLQDRSKPEVPVKNDISGCSRATAGLRLNYSPFAEEFCGKRFFWICGILERLLKKNGWIGHNDEPRIVIVQAMPLG
jgi:hypothetical protein